jgi:hypothetical protein
MLFKHINRNSFSLQIMNWQWIAKILISVLNRIILNNIYVKADKLIA